MKADLDLALVVLAAGRGTRMRNARPKVMHPLAGRSLIAHVVGLADLAGAGHLTVVLAPGMDDVAREVEKCHPDARIAHQLEPLGTGNAMQAALDRLPQTGTIIMLYGDTPLITASTIVALAEARLAADAAVVVMGMHPPEPKGYGRLRFNDAGDLIEIVEHAHASQELRETAMCNSGVMAIDATSCRELVEAIPVQPSNGEYYLTDIVGLAVERDWVCKAIEVPYEQGHGVNSQAQLAEANAKLQQRLRGDLLTSGVIMTAPETVQLAYDTKIAPGAEIEPNVVFGPGVSVAAGACIRAFSHIEGAVIGPGAIIGPYARIRPGSVIGEDVRIGNFVETKNTVLGAGAKANHLTYLGDCSVGAGSNIGAGAITCNYDGFNKSRTEIGENVFIGSNSALVAPLEIASNAIIGAGSTITKAVPENAIALTRPDQIIRDGAAPLLRHRLAAKKTLPTG